MWLKLSVGLVPPQSPKLSNAELEKNVLGVKKLGDGSGPSMGTMTLGVAR